MTIGSTLTYGRWSDYEVKQRAGNPYFEENGKTYRVTDLVRTAVGYHNYQAVECDPREVEQWLKAETMQDAPVRTVPTDEPPEAPAVVPAAPKPDAGDDAAAAAVYYQGYKDEPGEWEDAPPSPKRPPRLAEYARENGWKGRGPIPRAVKKKYEDEFGVKTYSY